MEAVLPSAPSSRITGHTAFEWLPGRRFVVQRWEIAHPDAPDGVAIIGLDQARAAFRQHYFDSRGVARLYEMTFADGVWTLSRTSADFSPLDFCQRFVGAFSDDGTTVDGRWERSTDGSRWEHDLDLRYTRLG